MTQSSERPPLTAIVISSTFYQTLKARAEQAPPTTSTPPGGGFHGISVIVDSRIPGSHVVQVHAGTTVEQAIIDAGYAEGPVNA